MINLFSKRVALKDSLGRISSEKLIENLDEKREELLAGGSIATPSFLGQVNKAKTAKSSGVLFWF
ncbi:hypothetical protein ACE1B6_26970 [Aerosakkonemataceae cyanobacterium BLCC-F154]|uniref:Uncharacterized protein n=1 Tax=Floridaenema fluviatile BLCC-F154 TaxID=3153640 RepID=A0ABV4YJ99_9CYAN